MQIKLAEKAFLSIGWPKIHIDQHMGQYVCCLSIYSILSDKIPDNASCYRVFDANKNILSIFLL